MNGIPMKLDYSKTLNEQLATFEYYKNRYISYEFQIMILQSQLEQKEKQWSKLKEWLEEVIEEIENNEYADAYDNCELATTRTIFRKMQEIEGGMNE